MKTIRYTAALLIILVIGFQTAQAQSARRSQNREKKEVATRTQKREVTPRRTHNTRNDARVERKEVQRQRATQPKRSVQRKEVQRQRATQPKRSVQRNEVQRRQPTREARKPVSISTPKNPRSDYRKADTRVYVDRNRTANTRVNKYSTRRYYGGNHYHYFYPTGKVRLHYHHDTHIHHYRALYRPRYINIYWTRNMYRDYNRWYPDYRWRYDFGYRIQTISIWDAKYNMGEVARVYGRVYATWYNRETDDYLLFFGGDYPYQEFTVVLPRYVARRFSWRPERYFLGRHITVTGLITTFDGIPEIVVKDRRQVDLY